MAISDKLNSFGPWTPFRVDSKSSECATFIKEKVAGQLARIDNRFVYVLSAIPVSLGLVVLKVAERVSNLVESLIKVVDYFIRGAITADKKLFFKSFKQFKKFGESLGLLILAPVEITIRFIALSCILTLAKSTMYSFFAALAKEQRQMKKIQRCMQYFIATNLHELKSNDFDCYAKKLDLLTILLSSNNLLQLTAKKYFYSFKSTPEQFSDLIFHPPQDELSLKLHMVNLNAIIDDHLTDEQLDLIASFFKIDLVNQNPLD